jgi:hypothetical protein
MLASLVHAIYRALTVLYPSEFRNQHRDDLVLLFDEMVADRGIGTATGRTMLDLIVTIPRYRLEAAR